MSTQELKLAVTANLKQPNALTELVDWIAGAVQDNSDGRVTGLEFLEHWTKKYPIDSLFEVKTDDHKVARHTIDMVASAHQIIDSLINGPGVMLTPEQVEEYMGVISKDAYLLTLKMKSFLSINKPDDVSYPMFVGNLFKELDTPVMSLWHAATGASTEAGELLDNVKKQAIYGKQLNDVWDKETGQTVVENLLEEVGDNYFYLQAIMNMFGWTIDDVILANRVKLGKRYKSGRYTDQAANERADKATTESVKEFYVIFANESCSTAFNSEREAIDYAENAQIIDPSLGKFRIINEFPSK